MPPSRVLLCLDKLLDPNTGMEQYSLHVAKAVANAKPEEVELVLRAPRHRHDELADLGATLEPLERWHEDRIRTKLGRLTPRGRGLGRQRYHLWHALAQDTRYLPLDPRVPLVLTLHDLNVTRVAEGRLLQRTLAIIRRNVDRASAIITGSQFAADEIRQHFDLGDKPLEVIYHGVTVDPDGKQARPSGLPQGRLLLVLGRVTAAKNLRCLIGLMQLLPEWGLAIAGDLGDTEYVNRLTTDIEAANLSERVKVMGPVSEAEKRWLFHEAEALLHPSLAEGFGLPVVEAMSFGTPTFVWRATALPEVAGDLAFYWDADDPGQMMSVFTAGMSRVRHAPDYAARLRSYAGRFTWERAASAYLDVYRSIIQH